MEGEGENWGRVGGGHSHELPSTTVIQKYEDGTAGLDTSQQ